MVVALVKAVQFAADSTLLFFFDSPFFLMNALGVWFVPERSYVYSFLIRSFAVPLHSLRAIVAMQVIMGAFTAWLLAFALLRFLKVRAWIGILAALVFAFDPVQVVYERLLMTETTTLLIAAIFLVTALRFLERPSLPWLAYLSFLGILLVSLRTVYLPVVALTAVALPIAGYFPSAGIRFRLLAAALIVSCGSTVLFHWGYRNLTGLLGGREPAYHFKTGFILLAAVAPLIGPQEIYDARVAQAVAEQNKSRLPLWDPALRPSQAWSHEGLVARIVSAFHNDDREANRVAGRIAAATINRRLAGFLRLGFITYSGYWEALRNAYWIVRAEHGSPPENELLPYTLPFIRSAFGVDVSGQHLLVTPSRRYHILGRNWYFVLLLSPLLGALALWANSQNRMGVAFLFVWGCLLTAATCLGICILFHSSVWQPSQSCWTTGASSAEAKMAFTTFFEKFYPTDLSHSKTTYSKQPASPNR